MRDDVQYYRDLYNLERVEALKGPNAMIFGRGGGGGVINRVTKEAVFQPLREASFQGGSFDNKRFTADVDQPLNDKVALRLNGMYENSDSFRDSVELERFGVNPTVTFAPSTKTKITLRLRVSAATAASPTAASPRSRGGRSTWTTRRSTAIPTTATCDADVNLAAASIEHRSGGVTIRNRTLFGDYDRFYQNFVPGAVTPNGSQVALTATTTPRNARTSSTRPT